MHDKKGVKAEIGDVLKFEESKNKKIIGVVFLLSPGVDTCNAQVSCKINPYAPPCIRYVTLSETEIVLKHDGTDPVPDPNVLSHEEVGNLSS